MDFGYIIAALVLIVLIVDLNAHNKKVDETWPDNSDQQHWKMRIEMKVSLYGHGFLLILLIGLFINSFAGK